MGREHVIYKEQRHGNFRIFIHSGAPVCHSLISFSVLSRVATPDCPRDVCSNTVDEERANPPFYLINIYEVLFMC